MDGGIITAGDLLFISNGEDYVLPHIVPANGKIVLRGIGEIQVLGQTPDQLAPSIKERLSKYYKPGSVRIYVVDPKLYKYYVDGQVNHSGAYCLDAPTTVLEALEISSGFRKGANLSKIHILRGSQVFKFNYKSARKATHP